jgi:hypothetical protein
MKWKARILSEYDTPICALRLTGVVADEEILIVKHISTLARIELE